ncbi:DJ-1/PfpI family protein [Streptomyces sp. NPDC026092]|uniref:DJ-1/PfpI family protein n=1 Tax=Streptomyces sp. NPDC026092 TaxID=3154797 RepID=UPI00340706A0
MVGIDRRKALGSMAGAGAVVAGWGAGGGTASAATVTASGSPAWSAERPLRVHIVAFDGAEELDIFGPLEVFGAARAMGYPVHPLLVTSGKRHGRVTASFGTEIAVPGGWDPSAADVLVVPGGGFRKRDAPGIWTEIAKGVLPRALARAERPSLTVLGVCTGVVVLHAAGLIRDRPCTTHHGAQQYLKDQGADVRTVRVVDDGNLVCAGGVSSGIDGSLWLLERELGSEVATRVEALMEFERRGTVLRTAGS